MNGDDYCELCDLPMSQCPHGRPAPAPEPVVQPTKARPPKVTTPRLRKSHAAPVTTRSAVRKWTPPEQLEPLILQLLTEAGGQLSNEAALEAIEERLTDHFRSGDCDRTPTGELRWQLAARKARQSLVRQGLMTKTKPGMWNLA